MSFGIKHLYRKISNLEDRLKAIQYHVQICPLLEFKDPVDEAQFRDWWKRMLELTKIVSQKVGEENREA